LQRRRVVATIAIAIALIRWPAFGARALNA
jgi:hypothetical protein